MRPIRLLLIFTNLLSPVVFLFGQDNGAKKTDFDFFAKGKSSYAFRETGSYSNLKYISNGQILSHSNTTYIDLEWNHWFGGLGAGLDLYANWTGGHINNSDNLSRRWSIAPNLAYGKTFSNHWGAYVRAGILVGIDKDITKSPGFNADNKANLFGYDAAIAFPYRFSKYTAVTTSFNYDYQQQKADDFKFRDSRFGLNIHLEDYPACSALKCDHSTGFKLSQHRYDQGSGFIDYDTRGSVFFGNVRNTYITLPGTYKNKYNSKNVDMSGSYYFIDHVAIGGRLHFSNSVQSDNNAYHYTGNYFEFDPEATINAPVNNGWRNLFIKGGGYFGSSRSETKSAGNTDINKTGISGFNVGVGYYVFFAEETALKTCIYYRSITNKSQGTGKSIQRGIGVSVALTHSFGNY